MRRNSGSSFRNSGAYASPGTPEYGVYNGGELPKTCSAEQIPLPTRSSRRHVAATALMPFNSGRTLPSKWDDAERWITSPVSGYGSLKSPVAQPQRRPKSKSGPLRPTELVYLPGCSPTVPANEGGRGRNFMVNSPLNTGVFFPDGLSVHYNGGGAAKSSSLYDENDIMCSTSVPGLSNLLGGSCVPSSLDDKNDGGNEEEAQVPYRDMATQMSLEGNTPSSSKGRLSFSNLPSSVPCLRRNLVGKDIRDVQVDRGTTTDRQLKKQGLKMDSTNVEDLPTSRDAAEAPKNMSKLQRGETKITAWENLQKTKAEAAIQKLEMKLEKKRAVSMNKITNELRAAQVKAQAMRNSLSDQLPEMPRKRTSLCAYERFFSICNCFLCSKC